MGQMLIITELPCGTSYRKCTLLNTPSRILIIMFFSSEIPYFFGMAGLYLVCVPETANNPGGKSLCACITV
jgi:hypothetical protein